VDPVWLIQILVIVLLVAKSLAELLLDRINAAHVRRHSDRVPAGLEDVMSPEVFRKSVDYTLARNRLSQWLNPYDLAVLLVLLFSGFLPWSFAVATHWVGQSVVVAAGYLISVMLLLSLAGAPWDWYSQFRLEERFGFNQSTLGLWVGDRLKGMLLAYLLGVPLTAALLKLVEMGGPSWWLLGWGTVVAFQMLMMIVAPMWILPLFNKLEPLEEGDLKTRLLTLGEATGFSASTILVMDGSKRSSHSNAFFTGFGRFRKIVLFDTLIEQLTEEELEAVLAHEIGHYKKRHVLKLLAWSSLTLMGGFWVLSRLLAFDPFFNAFGLDSSQETGLGFLLFGLLSGAVTFWTTPLASAWSRRYEYEADRFASQVIGGPQPLVSALKKLTEKNLGNLNPHPWYSRFYYSHPTLVERSSALEGAA